MQGRYTKEEEDRFFEKREFSTFEDDRKEMKKVFRKKLTEEEQVNNLLDSCSNWLTTRGKMPYFKNNLHNSHMMQEYGFKLLEVQKAYNRLLEEKKKLEKQVFELTYHDDMGGH